MRRLSELWEDLKLILAVCLGLTVGFVLLFPEAIFLTAYLLE